ncbi:Asp23/Gls24 family envelope stress response protein [Clostridium botulinum]|uniref:Asp23/Gls24 family envelope stress response protein n=1 Tax=Clostridium botulinum TaxID=1491 RepID=A0A0C2N0M5_CLOBO|nr:MULTISPECIES: Asp23/Gls24 family envelope stress response protein [Clostridium]ACD53239.1 asp23 family protein [Clostridium botulinum E3 str. Alaska E43]AJF30044.1 alkaline-shock protein [Clostridium botulinum]AJF33107.1 alkaline-shock protein [Clostridium botulinum]EES50935.1 asp23 family protein [Clostridium botulinum E1 str. 'BoNT E Beluga']KAI3350569.1 Asp23/Gls24 family envelope stress response protein [Clostridium botulinum]
MESLNKEDNVGIVKISDEVVSVIAGIAAQEIDGVSDYQIGGSNNLSSILKGKKSLGKSTKVTLLDDKATIDINLSVEYGVKIMEVVSQVQNNVKRTVEAMTGLVVEAVNVYVQNIYMPKKEECESK